MQSGFYVEGIIRSLTITDSYFENISIGSELAILSTGDVHKIDFSNMTFHQISADTDDDEHNFMIRVNSIDLDHAYDSYMNNITITESYIGFLDFDGIVGSSDISTHLYVSNVTYKDSYLKISRDLFKFDHLESTEDFTFVFDSLTFTNLTFEQPTNIFICQLQTTNGVILQNSLFSNIHSGKVHIEAFNKQITDNYAKMIFINNIIEDISMDDDSFISAGFGTVLDVINSTFSNMYTLNDGAALTGNDQKSTTSIYNSTFTN